MKILAESSRASDGGRERGREREREREEGRGKRQPIKEMENHKLFF